MFWGAATSAHQVEGNCQNDWTDFERERNLTLSGHACDHYNRYGQDFDMAQALGHNAHRFSIEWSRVEPIEGRWDEKEIAHYHDVIAALRARGLEPFVTLWHWTVPRWFRDQGGWEAKKSPEYFARYAAKMAEVFPDVTYWITLNEPNVYLSHGYLKGNWPPGERSPLSYMIAHRRLIYAHRRAFKGIKKINPASEIGIALNMIYFSHFPVTLKNYFWNKRFMRGVSHMQDFVGINYYFSDRTTEVRSDLGWPVDPEGFEEVLVALARYKKPIYILENGIADEKDTFRAKFIRDHVDALKRARARGADIQGYFYWSLLDNFEWDKGFAPRFGLADINYTTLQRTIRPSAYEYQKIISKS